MVPIGHKDLPLSQGRHSTIYQANAELRRGGKDTTYFFLSALLSLGLRIYGAGRVKREAERMGLAKEEREP